MAKLVFVAILIGITLSTATAVPSKSLAGKSTDCTNKPNGKYPNEPDTCSNSYVVCTSGVAYSLDCSQGLVFDASARNCVNRADAISSACLTKAITAILPPYGCSDKTPNFAYAITTCSISFYTCANPSAEPLPGSCMNAAMVFDYEKVPGPVDSNSCILRTTAPGCLPTTTTEAITEATTTTTTTSSTTTTGRPLPTAPCADCVRVSTTVASITTTDGRPLLPTAPCPDCGRVSSN